MTAACLEFVELCTEEDGNVTFIGPAIYCRKAHGISKLFLKSNVAG